MMESFNYQECAHTACGCPAETGSDYCSLQCEKSAGKGETGCNCGHTDCRAEA